MKDMKNITSDTYVAIIATSFALIIFAIPFLTNWPIPSRRDHAIGEYYTIILMVSAPCAFLVSSIALLRAVKAKKSQNINLGIASICLFLAFCLLSLFL